MIFRKALAAELNSVNALYQSVVGSPFCAWNAFYPGMEEVLGDFAAEGLYVLCDGEKIIGALSVVPENELDDLPCWQSTAGAVREIARVVVAKDHQGRGLAGYMVGEICSILWEHDCPAVHLSVAKSNLPACRTYQKLGFQTAGEAELYGGSYYLMEKIR